MELAVAGMWHLPYTTVGGSGRSVTATTSKTLQIVSACVAGQWQQSLPQVGTICCCQNLSLLSLTTMDSH